MSAIDVVLVILLVVAAVTGYRQGFVVGLLGFCGFLVGGAIGMLLAPVIVEQWTNALAQALVTMLAVIVCAGVAQALAVTAGSAVREALTWRPARFADAAGGALISVVAVLLLVWFLALAFVTGPSSVVTRELRASAILNGVDGVMPDQARGLFSGLRSAFDRSIFPEVFAGVGTPEFADVDPPDGDLADSPVAREARDSIVEVLGTSSSCDAGSTGSGFVYAPQRVMTNAHVVAGMDQVFVRVGGTGRPLLASVVVFDPDVDAAVLEVPDLDSEPLSFAPDPARRGDDGMVIGFPGGEAFTVSSARIRDRLIARGSDIYDASPVRREIYALRTIVRPGNSGGPLLDPQGRVLGVVFAASTEDDETGYALTAAQVADAASLGVVTTVPLATGSCI
jgi:S1-C subfamily serine protease